jgi:hypothetical protein
MVDAVGQNVCNAIERLKVKRESKSENDDGVPPGVLICKRRQGRRRPEKRHPFSEKTVSKMSAALSLPMST